MGLRDQGWDLPTLAEHYGIQDRLLIGTGGPGPPVVGDRELNLIYNLCDVGLNTSCAEGWGLVAFEHAATSAAQVVPGFGNCQELWAGAAELLPAALTLFDHRLLAEERLIAPAAVAAALERLYQDPDYRWRMALAAHRRACDPALDPGRLGARWRALFAAARAARDPLKQEASSG